MRRIEYIIVASIVILLVAFLVVPRNTADRLGPRPLKYEHKLKQLGIALLSYHDQYGTFPRGIDAPLSGVEGQKISWRVTILPSWDRAELYRAIVNSSGREGATRFSVEGRDARVVAAEKEAESYMTSVFGVIGPNGMIGEVEARRIMGVGQLEDEDARVLAVVCPSIVLSWMNTVDCVVDEHGKCLVVDHESSKVLHECMPTFALLDDGKVVPVGDVH